MRVRVGVCVCVLLTNNIANSFWFYFQHFYSLFDSTSFQCGCQYKVGVFRAADKWLASFIVYRFAHIDKLASYDLSMFIAIVIVAGRIFGHLNCYSRKLNMSSLICECAVCFGIVWQRMRYLTTIIRSSTNNINAKCVFSNDSIENRRRQHQKKISTRKRTFSFANFEEVFSRFRH